MSATPYLEETALRTDGPRYALQELTAMDVVVLMEVLRSQMAAGRCLLKAAKKGGLVDERMRCILERLELVVNALKQPAA